MATINGTSITGFLENRQDIEVGAKIPPNIQIYLLYDERPVFLGRQVIVRFLFESVDKRTPDSLHLQRAIRNIKPQLPENNVRLIGYPDWHVFQYRILIAKNYTFLKTKTKPQGYS